MWVVFRQLEYLSAMSRGHSEMRRFAEFVYSRQRLPLDDLEDHGGYACRDLLKSFYFDSDWHRAYSFVERFVDYHCKWVYRDRFRRDFTPEFNRVLATEMSGWRFVGGQLARVTDEQEIEELEHALSDDRFSTVTEHIQSALAHLSDRENPDYRNSIKESISAVEAMAKIVTGKDKATLTGALATLESQGKLHSSLKTGWSKLYGYTSDGDGIRHALMDEPNVGVDEAKYFLISCTSFVNYLKTKM